MTSNPDNKLMRLVIRAFKRSGLSIKKLSDMSGCGYASVHGGINGKKDLSSHTLARLVDAMGFEFKLVAKRKAR